ncbi:iron complex transport system permease protein [Mycetocola sp. BIGb0189]|uniref:FecCD family ABC transporter permease n=1 Tax=Mycetocola sp. BIGb0189 TaxID=2940604 RepID=UPI0021698215|nr:iron ABC transporter permease [Mycetocola sp. BIGb0189]MCS4277026.1 iron complex transport system permease protein [Mycetocola sp. BIGb0189]
MTSVSTTPAAARDSRRGRLGVRSAPINLLILVGLALLLAALSVLSLFAGSRVTGIAEVVQALTGAGDPHLQLVVTERIPRTIIGAVVGASLAVSGVIVQGVTRNPLGDPGLLGVSVGASAAVVTATAITGTAIGAGTVWVALVGALVTVILVVLVAGRPTGGGIVPLLLAGAVVSAVLGTYIQAMILTRPAVFDSFRFWVIGSLAGRRLDTLAEVAPALILGLVLALILASGLNALALGDDLAHSLGVSVPRVRAGALLAAALLCAGATALVGPIAFLGLAVPHLVRALVGTDHRWQMPAAILLGASVLIAADIVGRVIARPGELMVGVVTAFVGAPFLLIAVRAGRAVRG